MMSDIQIAAALAEQVYRHAAGDQAIGDVQIGVTGVSGLSATGVSLTEDETSAYYYDNVTGFVGRVVEANVVSGGAA